MTRYTTNKSVKERDEEPHPVWRGIGLLMIIGIPVLSYAIATQLMMYFAENEIRLTGQLLAPPIEVPLLGTIYNWPAVAVFTFVFTLILFGVFAVVNAVVYGSSSNQTLRSFESPPKQFKKKRKLRKPNYD